MSLKISIPIEKELSPKIAVFAVGGGGVNAVNNMISANLGGVDFFAANTDTQALENSLASNKIKFGINSTKGLGAGSDPKIGEIAAEESSNEIIEALEKYNLIFITAGMGGGTGTGGAPVVARLAKEKNILTVAVITKPFHFEGARRMKVAEEGLDKLQEFVDTLIIVPNQNLFRLANEKTTFSDAFKMADEVLHAGVKGITDLITKPGLINLDFADIHSVMNEKGKAMMGTGEAEGDSRAVKASEAAISNPLLDHSSMKGAKGVLINITGGMDMTLFEVDEAANRIKEEVDPNANIIFGSAFDNNLEGSIRVSVVATGIDAKIHKVVNNNCVTQSKEISFIEKKKEEVEDSHVNRDTGNQNNYQKNTLYHKHQSVHNNFINDHQNHKDTYNVSALTENNDVKQRNHNILQKNDTNTQKEVLSKLEQDTYYNKLDQADNYPGHLDESEEISRELINKNSRRVKSTKHIFDIPTFLRNKKD